MENEFSGPDGKRRSSLKWNVSTEPFDYQFKLILIGDSCVGKTAILNRYVENEFDKDIFERPIKF